MSENRPEGTTENADGISGSAARAANDLRVVFSRLRRRIREVAGAQDLTPSQVSALTLLSKSGAATASALVLVSMLNPINSSMIAVALVPIGTAFGALPSQTAWLVSALYLATAVGQPVIGRLVDTYGPRRLYLIGTALVGAAGVIAAL